jgi:hypothetical protein
LNPAGRKSWFDFFPEDGGEFKTHQTVKNAPGLLGVDEIDIYVPGIFDGIENCIFCYFIENNTPGLCIVQLENLSEVPGNGFSFAVFIRRADQFSFPDSFFSSATTFFLSSGR